MDPTFYIAPMDLCARLGTAHVPTLIDICVPEDVAADPYRLPGATRIAHRDLPTLLSATDAATDIVVICQKGLKLSLWVAAQLRSRGRTARALEGGVWGWGAAGLPRMAETAPCQTYVCAPPLTVHMALAIWVVRRWTAPHADILWVPDDMVDAVADRFDACPLRDRSPTHLLTEAKMTWAPLHAFLEGALAETQGWTTLLSAPTRFNNTHDAMVTAALPLIDAAWTALLKDSA